MVTDGNGSDLTAPVEVAPTQGCLACSGWRNAYGKSPIHNAGSPRDCVAREGCTGDYHRAECPDASDGPEGGAS